MTNGIIINNFRSTGFCGNYPDAIAVNCKTEEQAREFLNGLSLKWFSGEPLAHNTYWDIYKDNTCYCISPDNGGMLYSNTKLLSTLGFVIIDWNEFPKDKLPRPLTHFYDYKRFYSPYRHTFDFGKFLCKNNFSVVCCNSMADALRFCKNLQESAFWKPYYTKIRKREQWIIGGWNEDEGNICFYFDGDNDKLLYGTIELFEMSGDFEYIDYKYYD